MRLWAWLLALVVALAVVGSQMEERPVTPPASVAYSAAPPGQSHVYRDKTRWGAAYHRHRGEFQRVGDYAQHARTQRAVAIVFFLVFVLVTLPKNARGARAFYHQLIATRPLPPDAGDSDDNNRQARQVLFFYLLFLLYQIVQFFLAWGRDNTVQFTSDLIFQFVLMLGVLTTYAGLRSGLSQAWKGDPEGGRRLSAVLGTKVEGIPVRWRDMPRLAALMFVGGFTPALLVKLPSWLDTFAS